MGFAQRARKWMSNRTVSRNKGFAKRKSSLSSFQRASRMNRSIQTRTGSNFVRHHISKKVELKEKNMLMNATALSRTPLVALINGLATGMTATTRLGVRVELSRLTYRLQFIGQTNGADNQLVRMMIIYDTQPNGTEMTTAEVLNYPTDPITSLRDTTRPGRMQVLHDKTFKVGQEFYHTSGGTVVIQQDVLKKGSIPLGGRHPHYTGDDALIANINVGALYLVLWADSAAGGEAVTHPTVQGRVRLKYYDA